MQRGTRNDLQALLRRALAFHQRGELKAAEQLYRQVLGVDPHQADAHNLLGVLARQRGDLAAARRHGAEALALRPDEPVFLANQGATLAEAGQLPEAVRLLRQAVAARPGDAVSLRNLGQALCALGDAEAALTPLRRAVALQPAAPEPWLALAQAQRQAGDTAEAAEAAKAALARAGDAALAAQARFLLAALGQAETPDRAPADYVRDLFDQFAPRFDAELTERLAYRTPQALAEALGEAGVPVKGGLRVLDLGCGTGLSGLALAPFARRLEGLDLSPRMLAEAGRRNLYHALHEADLTAWLPTRPAAFDLVAAADVMNYLGDLAPALAGIRAALAPGGWMGFSVETGEVAPYALGEAMRYRHHPPYVAALAAAAGFTELARRTVVLRTEKGAPVQGMLFVLRLPTAEAARP
jgi:predicted TPR repeat methyltransferase